MLRAVLSVCFLVLAVSAPAATMGPAAAELKHGFFCALRPVATQPAEGTVSGAVNLVDGTPVFLGPGPEVPAILGIGFGVTVRLAPGLSGPVTVNVQHPPMGPRAVTQQTWNTTLSDETRQYLGYTFDEPYELLPGFWTLSASANGRNIYSVTFEVVDANLMPWVECGKQIPVS